MSVETKIKLPTGALQVLPIPGEPTCFLVESASAQCNVCSRLYRRWKYAFDHERGDSRLVIGGPCPYRGGCTGLLDRRYHKVDISGFLGHGECGCERFEFSKADLSRTHPSTWIDGRFRCQHIDAARVFSLDLSIMMHERRRMAPHARGRLEEMQP